MNVLSNTFKAALLAATLITPAAYAADATTTTYATTTTETSGFVAAHPYLANVYVGGQLGYNNPEDEDLKLDDTLSLTLLAGYKFNDMFRTDLEVSFRENDVENISGVTLSGDAATSSFLVNGWYDFKNNSYFTPYVGGGVGFTYGELDADFAGTNIIDDEDTVFTYQLGAGVAYEVSPNVSVTADYRYMDTSDFDFTASALGLTAAASDDYQAHEFRAGVRYAF